MNHTVREQVTLSKGSRAVLYDMPADGARVTKNLVYETVDGEPVWIASPGEFGPDEFIDVRLDGNLLLANTWSGFALWLDPASGQEIKRVFTK